MYEKTLNTDTFIIYFLTFNARLTLNYVKILSVCKTLIC
jgi:hypothetical protein